MDPVSLVLLSINSIRTLLSNPLLGGGGTVGAKGASDILAVLAMLIEEGEDGYEDLKAFTEEVSRMADENRGPTPAEWDFLRARADDAHNRLQAVKAELMGDDDEEEDDEETPPPEPPSAPEASASEEEDDNDGDNTSAPV